MQPDSVKKETQEHWSSIPIGTKTEGFDQSEPAFDKEYFAAHSKFRFDTYAPWLREEAGFERFAGKDVLEVGCGMGTDLLEFARGNARVVGIDLTPTHIKLATKRLGNLLNWDSPDRLPGRTRDRQHPQCGTRLPDG